MKYRYLLIGLLSTLALSCTVSEIDAPEGLGGDSFPKREVFYVSIDEQPGAETKVYADDKLRVLWNHDDRISIFNQSTFNREYSFADTTGSNSGEIVPVGADAEGYASIDSIYAVYPYQKNASISMGSKGNGIVSYILPEIQTYEPNSFGIGANTMISVTAEPNEILKFKNVGGYLAFKLCGPGVKVSSITLHGANNEPLAGPATIQMTGEGPKVDIASATASAKIKLYCKEPVELGSDPTVFWFVVPPVEFANGFSVTVATPDGATFTQSTSKPFTVRRSAVTRMASFLVEPTGSIDAALTAVSSTRPIAKSDGTSTTKTYTANFDGDRTFTILLPTVTDLSNNVTLNYVHTGDKILANGQKVQNGDIIKATGQETSLLVCKGDAEKRYTLKVTNTGLPVVRITTVNFDRTTVEGDEAHETWYGYDKKTSPNLHAYIRIDMPDGGPGMSDKDGNAIYEVETQIKGRGNASWGYPKRPYALKLDKKSGVVDMSSKEVMPPHKRWILLANWKDITLLRNDAAFWLSKQTKERTGSAGDLGLPYTVRGQFVELEFNGEHRGNYYLCEQIKIDPERVAITEMAEGETGATDANNITGGYLMEIDNNWEELNSFTSGKFNFKYQFKQPDEKDRSKPAYDYMTSFIDTVETYIYALKNDANSPYKTFFDIDSAIWFMLVNELTGNGDFFNTDSTDPESQWYGPHSTYFYKDRNTFDSNGAMVRSKLHMGPVWDFDYHSFMNKDQYGGNRIKWVGVNQQRYYFNFLLKDPEFRTRMIQLWDIYKQGLNDDFSTYVDGVANTIRISEGFDYDIWWKKTGDQKQNIDSDLKLPSNNTNYAAFNTAVNRIKDAFKNKLEFMDNNIGQLSYQDPDW